MKDELAYFEQRIEAARALAAKSEGIVRATHERFVAAYGERVAQRRVARTTVDELLG